MSESSGLIPLYLGGEKMPHQARVDFVDNKLVRILFEDEEFSQSMYSMIEEGTFRGVTLGWIKAYPAEKKSTPVFVYTEEMGVQSVGEHVLYDPEDWARIWGVRNYPNAIYFFGEVMAE